MSSQRFAALVAPALVGWTLASAAPYGGTGFQASEQLSNPPPPRHAPAPQHTAGGKKTASRPAASARANQPKQP